ncbi:MAG: hypothetical protein U1E91_04515 [Moraxella sp.]
MIREFSNTLRQSPPPFITPTPITINALKNWIKPLANSSPNKATALASLMKSMLKDYPYRGAYVDETRLYGNFTFSSISGTRQENQAVKAELICPQDFYEVNGWKSA